MLIHTVEKGDTLYEIGKKYGVTIEQLINANGNTVLPTLIIGQSVIVPTPTEKIGEIITNGYAYPNIERGTLDSFLPYLSLITPFSYGIAQDGTLIPLDDSLLITTAQNAGVRPLLLITTLTETGNFSSERAAEVLSESTLSDTIIQNIINKLETQDYYGVDIDFEYIPPQYEQNYSDFIKNLKSKLEPLGYKVFVSVAPKTSAMQKGLLYEAHNYTNLGNAADYVLVMTYEWGYTYGPPMAVAPIDKVREVLQYATSEIPADKVLMGIPNYAYDWTLPFVMGSSAKSMSNNQAIELARNVGAEIKFDSRAQTPYYNYYDQSGKQHEVWFEDARSIYAKLMLLNELGLAGYSIWNLMSFYKPITSITNMLFDIKKL